jgi:hypothetical protein
MRLSARVGKVAWQPVPIENNESTRGAWHRRKKRAGHPPGALREFQFPESTDLHGRVKQKLNSAAACARADFS